MCVCVCVHACVHVCVCVCVCVCAKYKCLVWVLYFMSISNIYTLHLYIAYMDTFIHCIYTLHIWTRVCFLSFYFDHVYFNIASPGKMHHRSR